MAHLAVDVGANGGKVYLGRFGTGLEIEEVHRFDNRPVARDGRYRWDIQRLQREIVTGLETADRDAPLETIGIDTWGVDIGLFSNGDLLTEPYAYRDPRLTSTREDALTDVSRREVFEATGITHWNTANTLWQYHYLVAEEPDLLDRADRVLSTPQVLSVLLGGRPTGERTMASTSQMLDPRTGDWATDLLERLDLPTDPLPEPNPPGTSLGGLAPRIDDRLESSPELLAPASHDTASAIAGLPLDDSRAFLSTGTWFIPGVELDAPRIDDEAFAVGASNELGVDGTVRFLKNVTGFFLLEECREAWRETDHPVEFAALITAAREAGPAESLVDPGSDHFGMEGRMPDLIRGYCDRTDQPVPGSVGEITRCILESLATRTGLVVEDLFDVTGRGDGPLHLGGGGVRNDLFCELLVSALDRPVLAGPAEATAVGNLLVQAISAGRLDGLEEGRRLVANAYPPTTYRPGTVSRLHDATARMRKLVDAAE